MTSTRNNEYTIRDEVSPNTRIHEYANKRTTENEKPTSDILNSRLSTHNSPLTSHDRLNTRKKK